MSSRSDKTALILVENLSVPFDRRVWQESLALTERGYQVVVICPRGNGHDTAPYEYLDGVHIFRYALSAATGGPTGYVREYTTALVETRRLIRELSKRWRFDVVQACNPPDLLLFAAAPLRITHKAALVFDHHDLVPELSISRFGVTGRSIYAAALALEAATFRLADVVISTNDSYRNVALRRGGKSPEDVFVVRSAPDTSRFRRVSPDPALRQGAPHLIAYLGVMGPQDGIDHALRALASLRTRRTDWRAVFVGAGDVLEDMRKLCTSLGLADLVTFTGRVSDDRLATILSTATVGICPDPPTPLNRVSTMNKTMEYMALGLPIAAYDLPETRVSAGDAALYADRSEPAALGDAIFALLDSPQRRSEMAAAGRHRVQGPLSWQHSAAQLHAAYDRAVEIARKRRRQELPAYA